VQIDRQPAAAETRERHLIAVLRGIRSVNRLIVSEDDPVRLIERACESLTATMGYHNAWIALLGGEAGRALGLADQGAVSATAAAGFNGGFGAMRERLESGLFSACMGRALETGDTLVTEDPTTGCPDCPLSIGYGGRAGLTRRLEFGGVTYGVLAASVPAGYARDSEEQELFDELAGDMAFGLHKIATARLVEASEARIALLGHMLDEAPAAITIHDTDGDFLFSNRQNIRLHGYESEEEFLTVNLHDLDVPESEEKLAERFRLIAEDGSARFEVAHHRKDGSVFPLEVMAKQIEWAGRPAVLSIATDITERKALEAEVRASEVRFRAAFDSASIGRALTLPDGRLGRVNRALCEMLGYTPEELEAKTFAAVTHPDDMDESRECVRCLLAGEQGTCRLEKRYLHRDGAFVWTEVNTTLLRDEHDEPLNFITDIVDITERKQSEQALLATNQQLKAVEQQLRAYNQQLAASEAVLRLSEEKYRTLVDGSLQGVVIAQAGPVRLTFANTAMETLSGFTVAELIGMGPPELAGLIHPEDRGRFFDNFKRRLAGEHVPPVAEYRIVRKDGQITWAMCHSSAIDYLGEPATLTAFVDISARKRAEEVTLATNQQLRATEQQLRAERDRLQIVMQTAPVAILMADENERVFQVNRAAEALFGEAGGVSDRPARCGDVIKCVHRREGPGGCGSGESCASCQVCRAIREGLAGGTVDDLEAEIDTEHNGAISRRQIILRAAPLRFGDRPGVILVAADITQMRALHAKMAQSDRLSSLGMLAAGVAHEINNPLSYVLYSIESLTEDLPKLLGHVRALQARAEAPHDMPSAEEADRLAQAMNPAMLDDILARFEGALDGTRRIQGIARGLGTFSRVEQDKLVPVDLMHVIDVALGMASNETKYRARLVKEYGRVPTIMASEGRLSQVFLNLVINAAHAIDEGDVDDNEIRVRTWCDAGYVFAEIRDTGCGIAPENLERLFDPFFSTKEIGRGSGLGLAIAKSIIEGYGGDISVESEVGEGTSFTLRIPLRTEAIAAAAEDVAKAGDEAFIGGRILIVDDEAAIRTAMVRMLRGHETVEASSGAEARQVLEGDQGFDLVLCDMMMPKVSGMDLHRWLREAHPALARRLVFVTGGAFTPRAREYLNSVDNLRLEKPFDVANFKKTVGQLIRAHRMNNGLEEARS